MKLKYRFEYRINKKGAECFRSDSLEQTKAKLEELSSKKPVYTMQSRSRRYMPNGMPYDDWSIWS